MYMYMHDTTEFQIIIAFFCSLSFYMQSIQEVYDDTATVENMK